MRFLALFVLFGLSVVHASASTTLNYYYNESCTVSTSSDDLRIRSTPDGGIIGRLANGTAVNVTDRWSKISARVKGKTITGWVATQYLMEEYVDTQGDNLNVRSVPLTGSIVGKLPNGTEVRVISTWLLITYKNGWVSGDYINCS